VIASAALIASVIPAGVVGVAVGSFLNVVIHRVPEKVSVVRPPSHCPGCSEPIAPRDNIPVLSWVVLRGRCRTCSMPISMRYPFVELLTGAAFVGIAVVMVPAIIDASSSREVFAGLTRLGTLLWFAAATIALSAIDLMTHRLPNAIVYPTIAVAIAGGLAEAALALDATMALRVLAGSGILFGGYLVLALAWTGGMGLGDVKLAAALGALLGAVGWGSLAVGAFAGFLLGGVASVILLIARRVDRRSGIPFGPFMLAGAWVGVVIGESAFAWYLDAVGLA